MGLLKSSQADKSSNLKLPNHLKQGFWTTKKVWTRVRISPGPLLKRFC
jgi:hypothetical protein